MTKKNKREVNENSLANLRPATEGNQRAAKPADQRKDAKISARIKEITRTKIEALKDEQSIKSDGDFIDWIVGKQPSNGR